MRVHGKFFFESSVHLNFVVVVYVGFVVQTKNIKICVQREMETKKIEKCMKEIRTGLIGI